MLLLFQNIFRSSSIDGIVCNSGLLIMDTSLVLENFFSRSKIRPMSNVLTLVHDGLPSDGPKQEPFQKV